MSALRPDDRLALQIVGSESVSDDLVIENEHGGDHLLGVGAVELSPAARHRVAAFIHRQLATLKDLDGAPS